MIRLDFPLLWGGHIIPAGKTVVLPADMEKRIVAAENAKPVSAEVSEASENVPPDGSDPERKTAGASDGDISTVTAAVEPELTLGRGAVNQ